MKKLLTMSFLLATIGLSAQNSSAEEDVKKTIQTFFAGMKTFDTTLISTTVMPNCTLKTIMQKKDGTSRVSDEKMENFYKQVAQLKGQDLDEQLTSYAIKIDAAMAIAWTPYKFFFNKKFSHCGVNVFTLMHTGTNQWKIVAISDTRHPEPCAE
jgi:hypothetical protein